MRLWKTPEEAAEAAEAAQKAKEEQALWQAGYTAGELAGFVKGLKAVQPQNWPVGRKQARG